MTDWGDLTLDRCMGLAEKISQGIMRFGALQDDFDEWLSSMQLSSRCSETHKMLPLFKLESSSYNIPAIKLWDENVEDESNDVFKAILDLPLLPYDHENIASSYLRNLTKCSVKMPKFCTDVHLGHVHMEQETPIESDKLFEFFQPPPIEEALPIDTRAESNPPLYLQGLNMVFAVLPDINFEVEPQSDSGWNLEACTDDEEPSLPSGLVESLLLDHYTSKDPNCYISDIDMVLDVDQRWCIAMDIQLPCDQIMCDENLDDLSNLGLEEHYFIESPSRDLFEGFTTVGIDTGSLEFFSSFEVTANFEEATVPVEEVPCSEPRLYKELTFKVASRKAQIKCDSVKDVCLEDCTVIVNYGTLMEYKVMSELSKSKARVVERDFGPLESRLLLLSSEHVIILSDPENIHSDIVRTVLERFAYVWVAVMICDEQDLSKTMIRNANSIAAMSVNRCKLLVLKDAKDLCHLMWKIRAQEKLDSNAEEALSAVQLHLIG